MKIIYLFSQYLAYRIGGAEESLLQLGKNKHPSNNLNIISYQELSQHGVIPKKYNTCKQEKISFIKARFPISFFPYLGYWLNKKSTAQFFTENTEGVLYTSSFFAPSALIHFQGEEKYFYIQSEIDLGIPWNHKKGFKYFLKEIYNSIEFPFRKLYIRDLKKALNQSKIICCSEYIAKKTKELYSIENIEIYNPHINYELLKTKYSQSKKSIPKQEKGIVFVGDAEYKGLGIALEIAKQLPQYHFHFFSKRVMESSRKNNISTHPWQLEAADIYRHAKLVIMPSLCKESFGRVAREAYSLGIPTLVSNHGGLPEAVYHDEKSLIDNFHLTENWITKIKEILA